MEDNKGDNKPELSKITKAFPIIKWAEDFREYLHKVIVVCIIPLAYVIHIDDSIPVIGLQSAGTPYYIEHEAIEMELTI